MDATSGYSWQNYSQGNGSFFSEWTNTPYNTSTNILLPTRDAAFVNWGGNWRMPTETEMRELIDNCTWTWQADYNNSGKNGYLVTSTKFGYTDRSIFLPAAGCFDRYA